MGRGAGDYCFGNLASIWFKRGIIVKKNLLENAVIEKNKGMLYWE